MARLTVRSAVNPLDIRINTRYKSSQFVPEPVKAAVRLIIADVEDAVRSQGWVPPRTRPVKVTVLFTFPTLAGDIDGPIKRCLDALAKGIKNAADPSFDDKYIHELHVFRFAASKGGGEPGIFIEVEGMDAPAAAAVSAWELPPSGGGASWPGGLETRVGWDARRLANGLDL